MDLTITQSTQAGAAVLGLAGWLDTTTAPSLQEALLPMLQSGASVVLDFGGVEYISSAGMRVLLTGQKTAQSAGGKLVLRNVTPAVLDILKMTGFASILTIE